MRRRVRTCFRSVFGYTIPFDDSMGPTARECWSYFWRLVDVTAIVVATWVLVILLTGCATDRPPVAVHVPIPKPVEVKIPVRMPCVNAADVPVLPAIPTREALAALPDYELLLTIEQLRRQLAAYALRADSILSGCSK